MIYAEIGKLLILKINNKTKDSIFTLIALIVLII